MAEMYVEADTHRAYESRISSVSWGSVVAGAVIASAMTILLLTFASAIGFSAVSPYPDSGVTEREFHIAAGLFTVMIALISSALGGYITGRLRTRWVGVHTDEVYFRDTAHGFLAWGLSTVMGATLIALSAASVAGGAAQGAAAGGAASVASTLMQSSYAKMPAKTSYTTKLFRAAPATGVMAITPSTMAMNTDAQKDADDIFTGSLSTGGDLSADDRAYLVQTVSSRTGMTPEQANARIDQTLAEAKQAAEDARKAAVRTTLWLTAALVMGAFASSIAAVQGGNIRDRDVPVV